MIPAPGIVFSICSCTLYILSLVTGNSPGEGPPATAEDEKETEGSDKGEPFNNKTE